MGSSTWTTHICKKKKGDWRRCDASFRLSVLVNVNTISLLFLSVQLFFFAGECCVQTRKFSYMAILTPTLFQQQTA